MKKIKLYSAIVFALSATVAVAQPANQFFLESLPQSFYINPAKKQQSSFHFDFLVPMNINAVSNGFSFNDLVTPTTGSGSKIVPANILPGLLDNNLISLNVTKHLAGFGFKAKGKNYFSYNASFKAVADLSFSKDFFTAIIEGPAAAQFLGGTAMDLTGTRINTSAYIEHGLGYSREVNDQLIIGGRIKLLQGIANMNGNFDGVQIVSSPTEFSITSDLSIMAAGPDSTALAGGQYFGAGSGIALDLGASYEVNDQITAFGSITDLGQLSWSQGTTYSNDGAKFTFDGLSVAELSDSATFSNLGDSIEDILKLNKTSGKYTTALPTRFFVGGSYQFTENWSADVLYSGKITNGQFLSSAVIGAGLKANRWFEAKLSYTIADNTYDNIGLAAVLNLGAWQLYAVTDNIGGLFKVDHANNLNASIGMNFTFGRKKYFEEREETSPAKKKESDKKEESSDAVPSDSTATPAVEEAVEEAAEEAVEEAVEEEAVEDAVEEAVEEVKELGTDVVTETTDSVVAPVVEEATDSISTIDEEIKEGIENADSNFVPSAPAPQEVAPVSEEVVPTTEEAAPVSDEVVPATTTPASTEVKATEDVEALDKVIEEIKQEAKEEVKELPADIK